MQITVFLTRAILLTLLIPALSPGALGDQKQQEKKKENQVRTTSQKPLFRDPSLASISEFRVLKPGMQVFRRARSLSFAEIINPFNIRKRGRFYGSVYHYHRNDFFDARNFFDPVGEKLPEFKRNQFGGSLGAFVTGRLQVFGTYDGLRINKGSTIQSLIPTPALGLLPSIALFSAQVECNCNGEAPSGEWPLKTDSCMPRFSGSPIPGT